MNDSTPPSSASTSRRHLTREYKEHPPAAGVYLIRSMVTQRIVLKASLNLEGAINRDRFELRMGSHRDAALQADFKRLGESGLRFEVVETLKPPTDPDADLAQALALALALWQDELLPKARRHERAGPLPSAHPAAHSAEGRPLSRLVQEIKVRARLRLKAERLKAGAAAGAVAVPEHRLRDCLHAVAREVGFGDWEHARHVLGGRAVEGDDQGEFWYAIGCSAVASPWFARVDDARQAQRGGAPGVLLPYRRQFLLAADGFLIELGLDPDSPLWAEAGRDLVRCAGSAAWEALAWQRLCAMRPRVGAFDWWGATQHARR